MLEGTGEWRIGNWQDGVSRDIESDKKPYGWRRGLLQRLQTAGQGPGKKNHSGTHGSSGGKRLDLVERGEGSSGH
jgi:hypothetical protein